MELFARAGSSSYGTQGVQVAPTVPWGAAALHFRALAELAARRGVALPSPVVDAGQAHAHRALDQRGAVLVRDAAAPAGFAASAEVAPGRGGAPRPLCFESVVHRLRAVSGDAESLGGFRRLLLEHCGLPDAPLRRKLVVLIRGSSLLLGDRTNRRWGNWAELRAGLAGWGARNGVEVSAVRLGGLGPCEMVREVHDATLLLGVHGADLAFQLLLPERAAVVAVDLWDAWDHPELPAPNFSTRVRELEARVSWVAPTFEPLAAGRTRSHAAVRALQRRPACRPSLFHAGEPWYDAVGGSGRVYHRRRRLYVYPPKSPGDGRLARPLSCGMGDWARSRNLAFVCLKACTRVEMDGGRPLPPPPSHQVDRVFVDVPGTVVPVLDVLLGSHVGPLLASQAGTTQS